MTGSRADTLIFQVNPDLVRVAGTMKAFLRSEPERTLELTPDTFKLLSFFARPRPLTDLLADPSPDQRSVMDQLVALKLLWVCDPQSGRAQTPPPQRRPTHPTFASTPTWFKGQSNEHAIVLLGAPFDNHTLPGYLRGSAFGPRAIRAASSRFHLAPNLSDGRHSGIVEAEHGRTLAARGTLLDAGDLLLAPGITSQAYFTALTGELRQIRASGARGLMLGGDHSLTLAAIKAFDGQRIGILHIDAHTDFGPIRYANDLHHGNVMRHVHERPGVEDIVLCGIRGLQVRPSTEVEGHRAYSPQQWRRLEAEARANILQPDLPYYVSIDIDALDPGVAPATSVPEPDGFGLLELRELLREILTGVEVIGGDLTELSGSHPDTERTAQAGLQLLFELIDLMVQV
ncbi:MAG: arginase family protein [Nannocystaceae bacterium]